MHKLIIILLLSILLYSVFCSNVSTITGARGMSRQRARSFTKCTLDIMLENFLDPTIFFIQQENSKSTLIMEEGLTIEGIFTAQRWRLLVRNRYLDKQPQYRLSERINQFLIFLSKPKQIAKVLKALDEIPRWYADALFILRITDIEFDILTILRPLSFRSCYKVIVGVENELDSSIQYYTWFPEAERDSMTSIIEAHMVGICENGIVTKFRSTLFPEKFAKSFEQFPLKIGTMLNPPFVLAPSYPNLPKLFEADNTYDGIEIRLVNMITEKLDIKPLYIRHQIYGNVYSRKNISGMMYNLSSLAIDVVIGDIHLNPLRYKKFDIAPTYAYDKITFVVPAPQQLSMWSALVLIFDEPIWFAIFFTMFALLIAMHQISYVNFGKYKEREYTYYQSMQNSLFTIVSILFASGFIKSPRTSYLRIIILMWAIGALILYSIYSSNLARISIYPQYEKHLQLDDLADTDLTFASTNYYMPYMKIFDETIERLRRKHLKTYTCDLMNACNVMLKDHKNVTVLTTRQFHYYVGDVYRDQYGNDLTSLISQNFLELPVTMLFQKASVFATRFSPLIMQINEAGFIHHWERTLRKNASNDYFICPANYKIKDHSLQFDKLSAVFIIWAIGMAIACFTFVCELIYYRLVRGSGIQIKNEKRRIKLCSEQIQITHFRNMKPRNVKRPLRIYTYLE